MRRLGILLALTLAGVLVASSGAGPIKGSYYILQQRISAGVKGADKFIPGTHTIKERFRGGQRAMVLVVGDHQPVVDVGVFVYDDKGKLVAKDMGGGDVVAAVWYPPRDAFYEIKIESHGKEFNDCYVVVK